MLLVSCGPDRIITQQVLDLGEQIILLIVVVRLDEAEPCLRVSNEGGLVGVLNVRGLEVDGVEATDDGVVQKTHVGCTSREEVGLWNRAILISPHSAHISVSPLQKTESWHHENSPSWSGTGA